jgi:hypothetical protein
VEAGHDEEEAALDARLQDAHPVGPDHLDAAAAADDVGDLVRRVARETRGAHGVGVDADQVGAQPDLPDQRQVGRVEHHDAAPARDVHVQRRLQAVERHPLAVPRRRRRQRGRGRPDDARGRLARHQRRRVRLRQVPRARHELGGEAREDAGRARQLEVGELPRPVALGGVAEEEHRERGRRGGAVVPPRHHAEGQRQRVALLHGHHLLLRRLWEDDAAGARACCSFSLFGFRAEQSSAIQIYESIRAEQSRAGDRRAYLGGRRRPWLSRSSWGARARRRRARAWLRRWRRRRAWAGRRGSTRSRRRRRRRRPSWAAWGLDLQVPSGRERKGWVVVVVAVAGSEVKWVFVIRRRAAPIYIAGWNGMDDGE